MRTGTFRIGLARLALLIGIAALPGAAEAQKFEFFAIGDMPYRIPGDYEKFDRLISAINAAKPDFTVHVGDIKSGSTPCSEEVFGKVLERFQKFDSALVYTPGDNEWTDCHRQSNGSHDPRERLARVRTMFYPDPAKSLGKAPIGVESQARIMPDKYAAYVENARFVKNGVLFVTVHVVGSNNGFEPRDEATVKEYFARNAANIAWIDAGFAKARADNMKALVIIAQADLFDLMQEYPAVPSASGFIDTIKALERGARLFDRPFLYIHGDEHRFVIDRMLGTNMKPIPKAKRLQVYGAEQVHGVRVTVDPDSAGVFGYTPLIIPENGEF